MNKKKVLAGLVALAAGLGTLPASAADKLKIGFLSTLSGPNASVGLEIRDGFNLAVKLAGGRLGGLPLDLMVGDDGLNPDTGKQIAERMVKRDRVDIITGVVFSNVVLAVAPVAIESKTLFISANAAPSALAGAQCNPYYFVASWPSDAYSEAAGELANRRGFKNVVTLTPNYAGGRDAIVGFKRYFKGKLADEIYTKLGQLDYAAEIAQIRAAKPDAMYVFLPGGMGINFIKQYVASGLSKDVPMLTPLWGADQDIIRAVGEPMLGLLNTAHWNIDLPNEANKRFVAEFEKEYKRLPTGYASTGYDTANLIDAAVKSIKGRVEDREALQKALRSAKFAAVRGDFQFGPNQYPVQNYYLGVVGRDAQGRIVNKTMGTIFTNRADAYVQDCRMK